MPKSKSRKKKKNIQINTKREKAKSKPIFPTGIAFINFNHNIDKKKYPSSNKILQNNSNYKNLGTYLNILYRVSTCHDYCSKNDHTLEYLTGRSYNLAKSGLNLMLAGFYDETWGNIRSLCEITNLFYLFFIDFECFNKWLKLSDQKRMKDYSPAKVRDKIKGRGKEAPVSFQYYRKLCETSIHVTPNTRPNSYNEHGIPFVGGKIMKEPLEAVLSDLANIAYLNVTLATTLINPEPIKNAYFDEINENCLHEETFEWKLFKIDEKYYYKRNKAGNI